VIGRFGSVDKLAEHPNQINKSPYAYAWNNPAKLTDPDGNCPICPIIIRILEGLTVRQVVTAAAVTLSAAVVVNAAKDMDFNSLNIAVQDNTRTNIELNRTLIENSSTSPADSEVGKGGRIGC